MGLRATTGAGVRVRVNVRAREAFLDHHAECWVCGRTLPRAERTLDHEPPVRVAPERQHDPAAWRTACKPCNSARGASMTVRWTRAPGW